MRISDWSSDVCSSDLYIHRRRRTPAIRKRAACMAASEHQLELVTIGRSCIDLYGEQVGGRLEEMASFGKSIGGSPTNTAGGAARLGLRSGQLSPVGADPLGRCIREQLSREGGSP